MQKHFNYDANAKISKNNFERPEETEEDQVLLDLFFLTSMKASVQHKNFVEDVLVHLDYSNEEIFNFEFKNITDTNLGKQILEKIKVQKTEKENLAKIPFDIIQKAMKMREEKDKMQQDGYYGEN